MLAGEQSNMNEQRTAGDDRGFILDLCAGVFRVPRALSPLDVIVWFARGGRPVWPSDIDHIRRRYVDAWVLANLVLVVALFVCSAYGREALPSWFGWAFGVYGGIRVFEIVAYYFDMLLFQKARAQWRRKHHEIEFPRTLLLVLLNYAEIVLWFAFFYRTLDWRFETGGVALDGFYQSSEQFLNLSVVKMAGIGQTGIVPADFWTRLLCSTESAVGYGMLALVIGGVVGSVWAQSQKK